MHPTNLTNHSNLSIHTHETLIYHTDTLMDPSGLFGIQHRAQRLEGPVIETPTADLLISAFSTSLGTAILCQVFSAV